MYLGVSERFSKRLETKVRGWHIKNLNISVNYLSNGLLIMCIFDCYYHEKVNINVSIEMRVSVRYNYRCLDA